MGSKYKHSNADDADVENISDARSAGDGSGGASPPPSPSRPAAPETVAAEDQASEKEREEKNNYILGLWVKVLQRQQKGLNYDKYMEELWEISKEEGLDKKFSWMYISVQRNNPEIPDSIPRQSWEPLSTEVYFKLHAQWRSLLAGRRTYLRPPKDNCEKGDSKNSNDVFRNPGALLGCREPLLSLMDQFEETNPIRQKIKLLSEKYARFRRTCRDGSCFYRGFFFSYTEHLVQMQDVQAEITRLKKYVARSRDNFQSLTGDEAYLSTLKGNKAYFASSVSEFEHLVNSIANGLSIEDLYKRNLQENMSSSSEDMSMLVGMSVLSFLRLLTEIEICKREDFYKSSLPPPSSTEGYETALKFCLENVRPNNSEADEPQIMALINALGIPLRVEYVDSRLHSGAVRLMHYDFFPQSDSGVSAASGPLHSSESITSSSSAAKPEKQPSDNLLYSDGAPLVSLLYRPGHYDILYRN